MTEDIKDKLELIADYHGVEDQCGVLQEECAELIQALSKILRARRDGDGDMTDALLTHVMEEIADTYIMMQQVAYLLKIEKKDIDAMIKYKIMREIGNIKARRE